MMTKTKGLKNYLYIKEKYNPMTDQEYIHLKQQQKKRSRKLKKDRERWIEEEDKDDYKPYILYGKQEEVN